MTFSIRKLTTVNVTLQNCTKRHPNLTNLMKGKAYRHSITTASTQHSERVNLYDSSFYILSFTFFPSVMSYFCSCLLICFDERLFLLIQRFRHILIMSWFHKRCCSSKYFHNFQQPLPLPISHCYSLSLLLPSISLSPSLSLSLSLSLALVSASFSPSSTSTSGPSSQSSSTLPRTTVPMSPRNSLLKRRQRKKEHKSSCKPNAHSNPIIRIISTL